MEQFVGLDVSQEFTHVCVVAGDGSLVWQGKCPSTPDLMAETIRMYAPDAVRIGFESGPLSTWHWHSLRTLGLPVICLDAKHARAALSMQLNKTDKNDALGLAQIVRMGWYREVGIKSLDSHTIRSMLGARSQLIGMRVDVGNQMRGTLKTFGIVLQRSDGQNLEKLVEPHCSDGEGMVQNTLRCLLSVYVGLKAQVKALDTELLACAKNSPLCGLLMTIPGIGPLTALAFITTIDDPTKFSNSRKVGAYLGLTPRRYQSGEVDKNGRISKCGDPLVRAYLFEAASCLLTRTKTWSSIKAWGLRLAKRGSMKKAKVAVARKLAVMMHTMWLTGEPFRWSSEPAAA